MACPLCRSASSHPSHEAPLAAFAKIRRLALAEALAHSKTPAPGTPAHLSEVCPVCPSRQDGALLEHLIQGLKKRTCAMCLKGGRSLVSGHCFLPNHHVGALAPWLQLAYQPTSPGPLNWVEVHTDITVILLVPLPRTLHGRLSYPNRVGDRQPSLVPSFRSQKRATSKALLNIIQHDAQNMLRRNKKCYGRQYPTSDILYPSIRVQARSKCSNSLRSCCQSKGAPWQSQETPPASAPAKVPAGSQQRQHPLINMEPQTPETPEESLFGSL